MFRSACTLLVPIACANACAISAFAADVAPTPEAKLTPLEQLIRNLNSDHFSARQRAETALLELGPAALPALKRAAAQGPREVCVRAERIGVTIRHRALRREFQRLAQKSDSDLDVEEAMWLISTVLDPTVRREDLSRHLDGLAERVRAKLKVSPERADPRVFMEALQHVLFVEEHFDGNNTDYSNPENSSLAHVLATHRGLPIILCHVVTSVCRRLHVPVVGLAAYGPFLVKYDGEAALSSLPRTDIYMHPFEGGRLLEPEEVKTFLERNSDGRLELGGQPRAIVRRMLTNFVSHLADKGRLDEANLVEEYRQLFNDEGLDDLDQ